MAPLRAPCAPRKRRLPERWHAHLRLDRPPIFGVAVFNDTIAASEEAATLYHEQRLWRIADNAATGTIVNDDPLPGLACRGLGNPKSSARRWPRTRQADCTRDEYAHDYEGHVEVCHRADPRRQDRYWVGASPIQP